MKKILSLFIIVLLFGVIVFFISDYKIVTENQKNQGQSHITGSNSGNVNGNNTVSFYKNNDQVIVYGTIGSSSILGYSGTILANIGDNKISYKNLVQLEIPSHIVGRNYRYFEGRDDGMLFGLSEKTGLIELSNLDTKNIIFVIENNKENLDIKTLCYDANESGPGDRVANEISNKVETIDGHKTYIIYRRYEPSTLFNGEICTIKSNLIYKIFIENYPKEEIQYIVNSFHFIQ